MSVDDIRQVVLSVLVQQDRDDLTVGPDGVRLRALDGIVPWKTMSRMCPSHWPWKARADVVTDLLNCAVWVTQPLPVVTETVQVHAQPVGSVRAPAGATWVMERVHGEALMLGWGASGVDPEHPARVVPVANVVWYLAGINATGWWGAARARQERDGQLCALRWAAEVFGKDHLKAVLVHDVLTLLGSRSLREGVTTRLRLPMVPMACPTRSTAWPLHEGVEPLSVALTHDASEPAEQGFPHMLLIREDEVAYPAGRFARQWAQG